MKTAIQKLIDELERAKDSFINESFKDGILYAIIEANKLLKEEKEIIMVSYWNGGQDIPTHISTVQEYYNQTFNQNK